MTREDDDEAMAGRAGTAATVGHDEVILRAADAVAREIRRERRARYTRLGLRAALLTAILMLALGAYWADVTALPPAVTR